MDDLSAILASIFSSGTFSEMLRRATPVALAAIGGSLTEHAGIMNIGMDGMILMGAFFGVFGSYLFTSAWGGWHRIGIYDYTRTSKSSRSSWYRITIYNSSASN